MRASRWATRLRGRLGPRSYWEWSGAVCRRRIPWRLGAGGGALAGMKGTGRCRECIQDPLTPVFYCFHYFSCGVVDRPRALSTKMQVYHASSIVRNKRTEDSELTEFYRLLDTPLLSELDLTDLYRRFDTLLLSELEVTDLYRCFDTLLLNELKSYGRVSSYNKRNASRWCRLCWPTDPVLTILLIKHHERMWLCGSNYIIPG